jgi:hypothetical protein
MEQDILHRGVALDPALLRGRQFDEAGDLRSGTSWRSRRSVARGAKGARPAARSDMFNLRANQVAGLRGRKPCPAGSPTGAEK